MSKSFNGNPSFENSITRILISDLVFNLVSWEAPTSQNEDVDVSQIQADRWEWSKFLQETALWCNGHPNLGRHKFRTTQTWTRYVYFQLNMFESLLVHTTPKLMPIVRPVMLVASSWKLELDLVGTGANLARISIDILGTKRHPQANAMFLIQYFFLAHRVMQFIWRTRVGVILWLKRYLA